MIYRLSRFLLRLALDGFFRRIVVQGVERIPAEGPALLVSNHTNAFVDPLLILTRVDRRITLTAKSALRRNPLLAPVIHGLGVLLVHRRQDSTADDAAGSRGGDRERTRTGAGAPSNEPVLDAAARRLAEGGAVHVFPEGQSHSDPSLRTFHTGAARIALRFLELGPDMDLPIIPIGLHFELKSAWRSSATALVGEPRSARAWVAEHGEDARGLTAAMEAWVRELTVNAESPRERRLLLGAAALLLEREPEAVGRPEPVRTREEVESAHRLQDGATWLRRHRPDRFEALRGRVEVHRDRLDVLGVTQAEVNLPMSAWRAALFTIRELELILVGLPLAFWGWLNHWPALETVKRAARELSTDEDHWASNAVFVSIPVFALFYLAQLALAAWVLPGAWALVYAFALPFTGLVALLYRDRTGSAARRVRTFLLFLRRPDLRDRLATEARSIIAELRALEKEIPKP